MDSKPGSPRAQLLSTWRRLAPLPAGRWLFSRFVGRMAPYSGTIGARIVALEPGYVRVELRDRRRIRNHLNSIHAVALANLGELATGLAVTSVLPDSVRGIPVKLTIEYYKKARGALAAECRSEIPDVQEPLDLTVSTEISDVAGDVVARLAACWRLSPQ
ncbi:MAG: hypothetical protein AMS18_16505 [Gemmatimonas sp. SG8_17]|nr:MAG: hypothetical protein AMS18_16505 [Gemmatimonas sp. SG8_17]